MYDGVRGRRGGGPIVDKSNFAPIEGVLRINSPGNGFWKEKEKSLCYFVR